MSSILPPTVQIYKQNRKNRFNADIKVLKVSFIFIKHQQIYSDYFTARPTLEHQVTRWARRARAATGGSVCEKRFFIRTLQL